MTMGELLREWRGPRSLREAGRILGCSHTTYRTWEADFALPGPEFYEDLMRELRIDADVLVRALIESSSGR